LCFKGSFDTVRSAIETAAGAAILERHSRNQPKYEMCCVSGRKNISYCRFGRRDLPPQDVVANRVEMFMPVVKVYRKSKMVCIDGPKKATGRMCELRK